MKIGNVSVNNYYSSFGKKNNEKKFKLPLEPGDTPIPKEQQVGDWPVPPDRKVGDVPIPEEQKVGDWPIPPDRKVGDVPIPEELKITCIDYEA